MRHSFVLLIALAATACGAAPAPSDRAWVGQSPCPASASSGWSAWIEAKPGSRPKLIATGKVETPTGGYRIQWADMRVLESYPVQIVADLDITPPSGAATQAVVTHAVRGEWPIDPPVGSFTVRCGDKILASIAPVASAR